MRTASFWEGESDGSVRCRLCFRGCRIPRGGTGFCGVRRNEEGVLKTFVADSVASVSVDPVEKKPLYHFLPGSDILSVGTLGCNFACLFCQNFGISRSPADTGRLGRPNPLSPRRFVDYAKSHHIPSVAFTYNEPTVFCELLTEIADLCLPEGILTVMVTNGGMSGECLESLAHRITAANVDLKSFREDVYARVCSGSLSAVKRNLCRMKDMGWWVEVTTLVVPGMNDSDEELSAIARFLRDDLGERTPWHVSAFFPCYRMRDRPPTPPATVERARRIGLDEGLRYVYAGNVRTREGGTTFCPECGAPVVERSGFAVTRSCDGRCPSCGAAIDGVWHS